LARLPLDLALPPLFARELPPDLARELPLERDDAERELDDLARDPPPDLERDPPDFEPLVLRCPLRPSAMLFSLAGNPL